MTCTKELLFLLAIIMVTQPDDTSTKRALVARHSDFDHLNCG
jgi:hypothetical protein